ncbi:MAG TPA: hypothetical protein VMT54_09290 [Candidatus Cybelea sp.]|nr:hypothetical protein [Candidatus Cybelea sp.]
MAKSKPSKAKPDKLTKTSKKGGVELSESDLKKATGGMGWDLISNKKY